MLAKLSISMIAKGKLLFMTRHTLLLTFAVIISMLPTTAHCDFFTDVSNAYLPDEVKPLMIGEVEAPIIEIEAQTPLPLGVAVVLTEPFPSSLTLAQGNSLASILAEKGWNVVISPFNLPVKSPFAQTSEVEGSGSEAQEAVPSADASQVIHPRSNQLSQYLDFELTTTALTLQLNALDNYLQDRTGYRMVIAQGMLATAYLTAIETQTNLQPDTFVAISPFWPQNETNNLVIDTIAKASFPILDLSLSNFNDWETSTAMKRKIRARNELKLHYRQVTLPNSSLTFSIRKIKKPSNIHLVANSTIGWTRHLGW